MNPRAPPSWVYEKPQAFPRTSSPPKKTSLSDAAHALKHGGPRWGPHTERTATTGDPKRPTMDGKPSGPDGSSRPGPGLGGSETRFDLVVGVGVTWVLGTDSFGLWDGSVDARWHPKLSMMTCSCWWKSTHVGRSQKKPKVMRRTTCFTNLHFAPRVFVRRRAQVIVDKKVRRPGVRCETRWVLCRREV